MIHAAPSAAAPIVAARRDVASAAPAASAPARVLVSLVAVGVVAALFAFRGADDNRLTSWRWAFGGAHPARVYALALAAVAAAHLVAALRVPAHGAALFVGAYLAAACFWGAPEVIVDASRYFTQAKYLELHGVGWFVSEWGRTIPAWTDLPLVPFLYGLAFRVGGESRLVVQALATALFAGAVVATYRVGRALWDGETGFTAGALLLAVPYLVAQAPSLLVDVPTMFFVALATLAAVAAFQRGGTARVAAAAAAVSATVFAKWSAALFLTAVPLLAFALPARDARRRRGVAAAIVLAPAAVVAAAVTLRHDVVAHQLQLLLGYQAAGLRRWGESHASTFLFQVHPFVTAAAAVALVRAARDRDALAAAVASPVLLLLALDVHRARYWIPALPMLALVAARGLRTIREVEVRRLAAACAVTTSVAVAVFGYLPLLRGNGAANLAAAGAYLDGLPGRRVEIVTLQRHGAELNPAVLVPLLDLSTAKELAYAYERPAPPAGAASSSLRFTWEYENPTYYGGAAAPGDPVAVVSTGLAEPLPARLAARLAGHRLARAFAADDGLFREGAVVRIYVARGEVDDG